MRLIPLLLLMALAAVATVAVLTRPASLDSYKHEAAPGDTSLAERINAACGPGWKVDDWTTGDEFDPLPPGVVQVTCMRTNGSYMTKVVAIPR